MYDKEKIYDKKINPLMDEIIETCKENDIQMFATFMLKEDDDIVCTTYIPSKQYNNTNIEKAASIVLG